MPGGIDRVLDSIFRSGNRPHVQSLPPYQVKIPLRAKIFPTGTLPPPVGTISIPPWEDLRARAGLPASERVTAPFVMPRAPVGELTPLTEEESIRLRAKERGESHYEYPKGVWKLVTPTPEVPLSRMPFSRQIEPLGEVAPIKQVREVMTSPEAEQTKQILSIIGGIGFFAYGGYQGIKSLPAITRYIKDDLLQKALNWGLDKWIAQRSRGVPPEHFKKFQDALYNLIAKDKVWLQERATENMLTRMGKTPNRAQAARQAVEDTISDIENIIIPRGTQTGATAFGGKIPKYPTKGVPIPPVSAHPLTDALKTEGAELIAKAEKVAPNNPDVMAFKKFLAQAQVAKSPTEEAVALKGMERIEPKIRELAGVEPLGAKPTPAPEVTIPEKPALIAQPSQKWVDLSTSSRVKLIQSIPVDERTKIGLTTGDANITWNKLSPEKKQVILSKIITPEVSIPKAITPAPVVTLYRGEPTGVRPVTAGPVPFTPDIEVAKGWAGREGRVVQVSMTRAEFEKLPFEKLPDRIATYRLPQELYAKAQPLETAISTAAPRMPAQTWTETAQQPSMLGEVAGKEVTPQGKGKVTQVSMDDQLKLQQARQVAELAKMQPTAEEVQNAAAQVEGLKATLATDPIATARFNIGGRNVDLVSFISPREGNFPETFTVKQVEALNPGMKFQGDPKIGGKVRRDAALEDLSKKTGMTPDEIADRVMQIRSERKEIARLQGVEAQEPAPEVPAVVAPPEKPPPPTPPTTTAMTPSGGRELTPEQEQRGLDLLAKYLSSPSTESAFELTRELRKEELSARFKQVQIVAQNLIEVKKMPAEQAMKQAIREAMSGELPVVRTDYFDDLTSQMTNIFYSKVYRDLKNDVPEMMGTVTALANALAGRPIPDVHVTKTGTVYAVTALDRLKRVFGENTPVMKAIETMAKEQKPLRDVVEGIYHETGRDPIPIDQEMAEYLRQLPVRTPYEPTMALPEKPVTRFEAPIENAFKTKPMFKFMEKRAIVRLLKELAWLPIDIGNFIRATKTTLDNSFLRQAKVLNSGHPFVAYEGYKTSWVTMFSQKSAEAEWQLITRDPDFELFEQIRQAIGADPLRMPSFAAKKGTAQWRTAEEYGFPTVERFIPRITAKLPHIRPFERAFVSGTNKVVWRNWKNYLRVLKREAEKVGSGEIKLPEGKAVDIVGEMSDFQGFLADAIQRASLRAGKIDLEGFAPVLSATFFAARSKLGRFLFPRHLIGVTFKEGKLGFNPRIMREAWKDFLLMNAFFGGLLFLGEWLGFWDVEKDPRNAEFMSARMGKIRIDPWAGYRQFAVLYARLATGTGVSSVTGAEYEVNKLGTLQNFVRGSLAPMTGILLDFWIGRNFLGVAVEVTNKKEWLKAILPMSIVDMWEAYELEGKQGLAIAAIPAFHGEGVQTYTGDWEENFTKLGLPKYLENLDYGLAEPVYDTKDLWADTASQFKGVDPATLTEKKGFTDIVRNIVETNRIQDDLQLLPSGVLTSINADPKKGTTFAQYYQMWQDREKIVASGDEKKLEAFDKDERTSGAYRGNFSQRQYALLVEYHSLALPNQERENKMQAAFKQYNPEINQNLREEYLKTHPKENAQLAIWGQAKIKSKEALAIAQKLVKELDIPDAAVVKYLKYEEEKPPGLAGRGIMKKRGGKVSLRERFRIPKVEEVEEEVTRRIPLRERFRIAK